MSGREKIKVYQYDREGKFLASYQSLAEVRATYYSEVKGKLPLFRNEADYHLLPDNSILFKTRTYRDDVVTMIHRIENLLIFKKEDVRPVDVFNMDGEWIATFVNMKVAVILTGIPYHKIYCYLNRKTGDKLPKNKLRIHFKYAE